MGSSWDAARVVGRSKFHGILRLLRVEHTLFSLPFAYVGAFLSGYDFSIIDSLLMATAVFGLRSAGMSYNNIADLDIDRANPRTRGRPLVTGIISLKEAWLITIAGSLVFVLSAAMLNRYALLFSPILLAVTLTYPYAKRIHKIPHVHLGLVLGSVVFGGAIAASGDEVASVNEALSSVPWIYVAAITLWVAGFDILYSIMDYEFDKKTGLGSIPVWLGVTRAKLVSFIMHLIAAILFIVSINIYSMGPLGLLFTLIGVVILLVQHYIAVNLENLPIAFNMNLIFPIIISSGVIMDKLSLIST
ncbi:MAG: putative 4-hydroxybenzoate polyprenyltransferase [Desulfurococcales archaeon]|nr:putative 4-hydroxybenzoate polyprenyltransferase [Desulfurococcales archaeon]